MYDIYFVPLIYLMTLFLTEIIGPVASNHKIIIE
jgi:hypothetical protein